MDNNKALFNVLKKFLALTDWKWVHFKICLPNNNKHELFFTNPNYKEEIRPSEQRTQPISPKTETLLEKIQRLRTASSGSLTPEEEIWWKERQKELEARGIGQIMPNETTEQALEKFAQIGIK